MRTMIGMTLLVAAALVSGSVRADTVAGTFSQSFSSPGGCFSTMLNRGIGTGFSNASVHLVGFSMQYSGDGGTTARPTNREAVDINGVFYNALTGNVGFFVTVCHQDDNRDDDFNGFLRFTIIGHRN